MAGSYEKKTREIKRSLHRRARLRRNYFKLIGDTQKPSHNADEPGNELESAETHKLDAYKSHKKSKQSESEKPEEPKLTGKQLASRKRAERYHKQKEAEAEAVRRQEQRARHKTVMKSTTKRGQPKLGSQIGVLLDKIRKQ